MTNEPIFIVGTPRSGTTLMRSILSGNPRIVVSPETAFMEQAMQYNKAWDLSRDEDFSAFWERYTASKWFPRLGVKPDKVLARVEAKGPRSYKTVFEALMEAYAEKMRKTRWGEKTPGHELFLGTIFHWYPEAKVLFMVRDPRGVSGSRKAVPWGCDRVYVHASEWKKSIQAYERWKDDERVMTVVFEDLLRAPEAQVRRICDFLGEDFAPSMLHRSGDSMPVTRKPGWTQQYERQVLQPVNTESIDKWRKRLSRFEVGLIEHLVGEEMADLGYQRETSGLTPLQLVWWQLICLYRFLRRTARAVLPKWALRLLGKEP